LRLFKTKWFARFARKEQIENAALREAIERADQGQIDADLGGGVIKQRIARQHEGRSGGYRSVVVYLKGGKAFFVYGFAKSKRENIDRRELQGFRALARELLSFDDTSLTKALMSGALEEVDRE
jgi:hypothetical protein